MEPFFYEGRIFEDASEEQRLRISHCLEYSMAGCFLAGFLLMPPTRHNLVHLNEALRLKKRRS
ncbi:MAG: hypothetical protein JXA13_13940 [Anaerolineales bacterium]|nr:hypothetical protein [Anaerolineales bacterium]